MRDVLLMLGPIAFRDFEIPAGINLGGKQRLIVHRLPGGSRVIDALGRDDAQISFSGIFSGADATLRARALDEMRSSGVAFPLTWDVFYYTVLISQFQADYQNGWWIPYHVTCTVLRDEASVAFESVISLAGSVLSDTGTAIDLASNAGVDISALQPVVAGSQATTRGTDSYSAALAALAGAQQSVDSSIVLTTTTVASSPIAGSGSAQDTASNLLRVTDALGQLSMLTTTGFYLQRAATNLTNAST